MRTTKERTIPRAEVLYDEDTLSELRDEYENPTEIKRAVETRAMVYEIRTALRFWFDGKADFRTSDRIWSICKAVENGHYTVECGQLVYADDVEGWT